MLFVSKYGNPYYYLVSGIILIAAMSYSIFENPGDIFQMFLLILGFVFVITGIVMLVYKQRKKKLKDNT
ncbi:hypothetical protein LCGC14_1340250 [marine sediment metagenome]|uniref:Gram-positive cocci surface proteins LPxTG domain-containing protein n=1 Tax=marine sediment metagenome TaxID=412755 RepID=A0A0F9NG77_9ZZZZ